MEQTRFHALVEALFSRDVDVCVSAAKSLQQEATADDVPRLLNLLENDDFFIREAAAWPLAVLVGPSALPQLLKAYQLGFEQGHDNDGFAAALLEIPALFPREARMSLEALTTTSEEPTRGHAAWLLEFTPRDE